VEREERGGGIEVQREEGKSEGGGAERERIKLRGAKEREIESEGEEEVGKKKVVMYMKGGRRGRRGEIVRRAEGCGRGRRRRGWGIEGGGAGWRGENKRVLGRGEGWSTALGGGRGGEWGDEKGKVGERGWGGS